MKKFFAYARVSTQEQADKDLSIPAQLREIRKFAHERGFLVEKEFTDVESAKLPGRTNYAAMMAELATRSDIAGVISHKLDRLLRNLKDYADVDDLMRQGREFRFVTESYDDTASGKLALGVRVLFAKHYLDNLSEEVRKGMNERLFEKGKWAFQPPLGYTMVNAEVFLDPIRAPLLKKAFEIYATGDWSLHDLTDWLYLQGLRSRGDRRNPSGGRVVHGRVHHLLRNPFYYGMMRYKGQLLRGTHEPLINRALFEQVRAILDGRGKARPKKKWFAYRGLLVCGECGRAITAELQKGHVYYRCTRSRGPDSCHQPYLREEELTRQFDEQLRAIELDDEEYAILRDILKQSHADEQRYRDEQLERLQRIKSDLQRKEDVLLDRLLDETITREVYDAKFTALEQEKGTVEAAIVGHEQANRSYFEQMEKFLEAARSVSTLFVAGDLQQKRELIQNFASNGVLMDRTARLNLKRGPAVLVERPKTTSGAPSGIRTRVAGLKDRRPRPT